MFPPQRTSSWRWFCRQTYHKIPWQTPVAPLRKLPWEQNWWRKTQNRLRATSPLLIMGPDRIKVWILKGEKSHQKGIPKTIIIAFWKKPESSDPAITWRVLPMPAVLSQRSLDLHPRLPQTRFNDSWYLTSSQLRGGLPGQKVWPITWMLSQVRSQKLWNKT